MEHGLSPTPDALYVYALTLHVGDRAMLAGCREVDRLAGSRPEATLARRDGS